MNKKIKNYLITICALITVTFPVVDFIKDNKKEKTKITFLKHNKSFSIQQKNELLTEEKQNGKKYIFSFFSANKKIKFNSLQDIQKLLTLKYEWAKNIDGFITKNNLFRTKEKLLIKDARLIFIKKIENQTYYELKIPYEENHENKKEITFLLNADVTGKKLPETWIKENIKIYQANKQNPFELNKKTFDTSKKILENKIWKILKKIDDINRKIKPKEDFYFKLILDIKNSLIDIQKNINKINAQRLNDMRKIVWNRYLISKKIKIIKEKQLKSKIDQINKIRFLYKNFILAFQQYRLVQESENKMRIKKGRDPKINKNINLFFEKKWIIEKIIKKNNYNQMKQEFEILKTIQQKNKIIKNKIIELENKNSKLYKEKPEKINEIVLEEKWILIEKEILEKITPFEKKIFNFISEKISLKNKLKQMLASENFYQKADNFKNKLKENGVNISEEWFANLITKFKEIDKKHRKIIINPIEESDKFIFDSEHLDIKFLAINKKKEMIDSLIEVFKNTESNYEKSKVIPIYREILNKVLLQIDETEEFKSMINKFWYFMKMQKSNIDENSNPLIKKIYQNIKFVYVPKNKSYSLFYNSNISKNISLELDTKNSPHLTGYISPQYPNSNGNPQNSFASFIVRAKNGYKFNVKKKNGKGYEQTNIIRIFKFVNPETNKKIQEDNQSAREYFHNNPEEIYENLTENGKIKREIKLQDKKVKIKVRLIKVKNEDGKDMFANIATIEKDVLVNKKTNNFIKTSYSFYLKREYLEKPKGNSKFFWGYDALPKKIKENGLIQKSVEEILNRQAFLRKEYFTKNNEEKLKIWRSNNLHNFSFDYNKDPKSLINYILLISEGYKNIIDNIEHSSKEVWHNVVNENQSVWEDIEDAFEDLGKELGENVLPVLQYILDPGLAIQKVISVNSNISMEKLDEILKINKNSDEALIDGVIPNNILSFGTNIAILPLTMSLQGLMRKIPKIPKIKIMTSIKKIMPIKRISIKMKGIIKSKILNIVQLNKLGIYNEKMKYQILENIDETTQKTHEEKMTFESKNEESIILNQKEEEIIAETSNNTKNIKEYVDNLMKKNKEDLSQIGADGGEEAPIPKKTNPKKEINLGLKGGMNPDEFKKIYDSWNNKQKMNYFKKQLLTDYKIREFFSRLDETKYAMLIEENLKRFEYALENSELYIKNKKKEIYQVFINSKMEPKIIKNKITQAQIEIIISQEINRIFAEKMRIQNQYFVEVSKYNMQLLEELRNKNLFPYAEIECVAKALKFAILLEKDNRLEKLFTNEKLFKIFNISKMLLEIEAENHILEKVKNWINIKRDDFLKTIEEVELLENIVKKNISEEDSLNLNKITKNLKKLDAYFYKKNPITNQNQVQTQGFSNNSMIRTNQTKPIIIYDNGKGNNWVQALDNNQSVASPSSQNHESSNNNMIRTNKIRPIAIDDDTPKQVQKPSTSKESIIISSDSEDSQPIKSFSLDDLIEEDNQKNIFDQEFETGIGKGDSKTKGKGKGKGKAKTNKASTSNSQEINQTDDITPPKKQKLESNNNAQGSKRLILMVKDKKPVLFVPSNIKLKVVVVPEGANDPRTILPSTIKNNEELEDLPKRKSPRNEIEKDTNEKTEPKKDWKSK